MIGVGNNDNDDGDDDGDDVVVDNFDGYDD